MVYIALVTTEINHSRINFYGDTEPCLNFWKAAFKILDPEFWWQLMWISEALDAANQPKVYELPKVICLYTLLAQTGMGPKCSWNSLIL